MELRRALLLFVIVLAVAAIVSSIARPPEGDDEPAPAETVAEPPRTAGSPSASPVDTLTTATLRLPARTERRALKVAQGRPATLLVGVKTPGEVEIPSLGLIEAAEPLTPARFDVRVTEAGRHAVVFRPVDTGDDSVSKLGVLSVVAP